MLMYAKDVRDGELPINKIVCGDCIEVMRKFPPNSIDLIIADPPYNVNLVDTRADWDKQPVNWDEVFREFRFILKPNGYVFIFGMLSSLSWVVTTAVKYGFRVWFDFVWVKEQSKNFTMAKKKPMNQHEIIVCLISKEFKSSEATYNYKEIGNKGKPYRVRWQGYSSYRDIIMKEKASNGFRYPTTVLKFDSANAAFGKKKETKHPTEKPLDLIMYLVRGFSKPNDVILDPFLGSGTTAVACKILGRKFIGIEIDEKWCKVATERLKKKATLTNYVGLSRYA